MLLFAKGKKGSGQVDGGTLCHKTLAMSGCRQTVDALARVFRTVTRLKPELSGVRQFLNRRHDLGRRQTGIERQASYQPAVRFHHFSANNFSRGTAFH